MKTIIVTLLAFCMASAPLAAQEDKSFDIGGVGLGSRGVNFRSDPDTRYGLLIRSGFGFAGSPFDYYFNPEAAFVKRHHYSTRTKLYAGAGVASSFRLTDDEFSIAYGLLVPVGLELFPIPGNHRLSVSLETGLNYLQSKDVKSTFGHYGLIEFTWYLRSDIDSETKYGW